MNHAASVCLSRRNFGRRVALGCMGASLAACQSAPEAEADDRLAVATESELSEGDVVDFEYPEGHAAFLVKLEQPAEGGVGEEEKIVAFHRACTHQGCPISEIDVSKATLGPCPCHFSVFDLRRRGAQVVGRATQNLVQIRLQVVDDEIYATGVDGVPFGEAFTAEEML